MISVVIPSYKSWSTLPGCLEALARQNRRPDEILVVNSSQETAAAEVAARFPFAHFIQSPTRLLPHAARNEGIAQARGDLLVMTDPDCEAEPGWIASLERAWQEGAVVLGGAMDVVRSSSWMENGIHLVKFAHALAGSPQTTLPLASTANAAMTRSAFETIGPFRADLMSGDAWFSRAATAQGFTIRFVADAVVRHVHGHSLNSLFRERLARGQEFAKAQDALDALPRGRRSLRAVLALPGALRAAARNGDYAVKAGWGGRFLATLPIQIVGQAAWGLGEATGHLSH